MTFHSLTRWRAACLALFVLALAVRGAYIWTSGAGAFALSSDAQTYHDIAVNLVTRHEFVSLLDPPHTLDGPYATRPPLTPLFLAAVYLVFGTHLLAGQLALAVVGALACVVLAMLGKRVFSPVVGLTAAVLAAVYPFFVFLSTVPLTENLAILLYATVVLQLVRLRDSTSQRDAWLAGILIGAAALNKPTILFYIPLVAVWVLVTYRAERLLSLKLAAALGLGALLVMAPWTMRNYASVGGMVPVTTQGGWTLYVANGVHADYSVSLLEAGATGWRYQPGYAAPLAGRSPIDSDREAGRLAFAFIREHPREFAALAARKVRIFWGTYPHVLHRWSWWGIAGLALIGLVLAGSAAHRTLAPGYLLVLQTAAIPVFFTSMPRFRAPIEPLILLLAAVPLVAAGRALAARRRSADAVR
jgi:4-amino-4-deoxy-L-arabinose transferase-like glycosyltransferase